MKSIIKKLMGVMVFTNVFYFVCILLDFIAELWKWFDEFISFKIFVIEYKMNGHTHRFTMSIIAFVSILLTFVICNMIIKLWNNKIKKLIVRNSN